MRFFLILVLCGSAFAACPDVTNSAGYVRAAASGSASGADWTNAYTAIPASLVRGCTYYIAGGAYAVGHVFNDAVSGTTPITLQAPTIATHGTSTGWSNTYQAQATWTCSAGCGPIWDVGNEDYLVINGSYCTANPYYPNICAQGTGGFSLVCNGHCGNGNTGNGCTECGTIRGGIGYNGSPILSHDQSIEYVSISGNYQTSDTGLVDAAFEFEGGSYDLYFGHLTVEGATLPFYLKGNHQSQSGFGSGNNITIEYSNLYYNYTAANPNIGPHGAGCSCSEGLTNFTIRYNLIGDMSGTATMVDTASGGNYNTGNGNGGPQYQYGNIFYCDVASSSHCATGDGTFAIYEFSMTAGDFWFVNNSIINTSYPYTASDEGTYGVGIGYGAGTAPMHGWYEENNLWFGSDLSATNGSDIIQNGVTSGGTQGGGATWTPATVHGYDAFFYSPNTGANDSDSHKQVASVNPFVASGGTGGFSTQNYNLATNTTAGTTLTNTGTYWNGSAAVANTFSTDMNGVARAANGTWDRGAMQIPGAPITLTVTAPGGAGSVSDSQGGIACGITCSASYASGTSDTLTATPSSSFSFVGWGGACSGITTLTCALTLSANTSVTAYFIAAQVSAINYSNLDDSLTGWQNPPCSNLNPAGSFCAGGNGTPPSLPTQTINNTSPSLDGESMLVSVVGQSGLPAGETTNVLWPWKAGANNNYTTFVGTYHVYLPTVSNIQALEYDQFQFNSGTRYMMGSECDSPSLAGGMWRIWNQLTSSWVTTTTPCTLLTTPAVWHTIVWYTHRVSGDTACSGHACMYYDYLVVDGVVSGPFTAQPSGTSSDANNNGIQAQIDASSAAGTASEYIDEMSLSLGSGIAQSAQLPTTWVNNNEGNAAFTYELQLGTSTASWVTGPPPTCTFTLASYVTTFTGLQAAVNAMEACRTLTGVGIALDVPPGLYTTSSPIGLVLPQSNTVQASNFLVLRSTLDASLPNGTIVCAKGPQDNDPTSTDIGIDNPQCNGVGMYYQLGVTETTIPAGAFTLANGTITSTSAYNDVQYMWTLESSGSNPSSLTTCSPIGVSGSSNPPKCAATTIAPDHWLIEDAEIRMSAGNTGNNNIVNLPFTGSETTITQLPTHIHFRKLWVHGDWTTLTAGANAVSNAFEMSCVYCSVVDSQMSQLLRPGAEGHVIWTGYGSKFKFDHNWMEGQSSPTLSGGFAFPISIAGLVPNQDVEMRRNRATFPYTWLGINAVPAGNAHWAGQSIERKTACEFKLGQRILQSGNIFENVDNSGGQQGPLCDYKVSNNSGGINLGQNYQNTTTDITIANNIFRIGCQGPEMIGATYSTTAGGGNSYPLRSLSFLNNLMYGISNQFTGCSGTEGVDVDWQGLTWQGTATMNSAGTALTFVATCSVDAGGCPGQITSGTVLTAGTGCVSGGAITISAPNLTGGYPASATTTCTSGAISGVTMTNYGTGYTSVTGVPANGTGTVQLNIQTTATQPPVGAEVFDLSVGDPVSLTQCTVQTAFNQPLSSNSGFYYFSGRGPLVTTASAPWSGSFSSAGVTVTYAWAGTASATDTAGYCKLTNEQGVPHNFIWDHNTFVSGQNFILTSDNRLSTGANLQQNPLLRDSIWIGNEGWQVPDRGEGTPTETFNYDTTTMTADHLVFPGRTAANYTAYCNNPSFPCITPVMYFPATAYCTGATPTVACVGFIGAMSAGAMPLILSDYHNFALIAGSSFKAGGTDQASDGTDMGASIPAIDAAMTAIQYVCTTSCGSPGPFADNPNQVIIPLPAPSQLMIQVAEFFKDLHFSGGTQ